MVYDMSLLSRYKREITSAVKALTPTQARELLAGGPDGREARRQWLNARKIPYYPSALADHFKQCLGERMAQIPCRRCRRGAELGTGKVCRGCNGLSVDHPELFGSCGEDVGCPTCGGTGLVDPAALTAHERRRFWSE